MKTITLNVEDCDQVIVDEVIVDELKDAYRVNNQFDKVDCSDDVLDGEMVKEMIEDH
jgi:hypothetical protein